LVVDTDIPIVPRNVALQFPRSVPRHWAADPVLTRILDAFSLLFPAGEQFFIRSVQCYRERITSPELRRQVKNFACQEARHSNTHAAYNAHLADQGLTLAWVERSLQVRLALASAYLSDVQRLAITAAGEHLTATMAVGLLASMDDHLACADLRMRALYLWHAVEEVEHKAVAWDVYEQVARGSWGRRIWSQLWLTILLSLNVALVAAFLLWHDGLLFDPGTWRRSGRNLCGRRGFFTRMVRPYLLGFRPGFHPSKTRPPRGFVEFVDAYRGRPDVLAASAATMATLA
jgi:uncharacterized protein